MKMGSSQLGALRVEKRICHHGREPGDREGTGGPELARGRAHREGEGRTPPPPPPRHQRREELLPRGPRVGQRKAPSWPWGEEVASWTCEGHAACQGGWGLEGSKAGPEEAVESSWRKSRWRRHRRAQRHRRGKPRGLIFSSPGTPHCLGPSTGPRHLGSLSSGVPPGKVHRACCRGWGCF